jgi:hypothetical protein
MKIKPCRICGSTEVEFQDCGYSAFNVGYGKCSKCGHTVDASCGCLGAKGDLIRAWNKDAPPLEEIVQVLRKQLKDAGIKPKL